MDELPAEAKEKVWEQQKKNVNFLESNGRQAQEMVQMQRHRGNLD